MGRYPGACDSSRNATTPYPAGSGNTHVERKGLALKESAGSSGPSPRRVRAGRLNRQKRGPLTPEGKQRLCEAAQRHRPWEHATGPRTPAGKARAARNGKQRQCGPRSVREIRADLAEVAHLIGSMRQSRNTMAQALAARQGSIAAGA